MNLALDRGDFHSTVVDMGAALAASLGAAAIAVFVGNEGKLKITAYVLVAVACIIGVYLSRNPRLCCLWGLMLTITLDVSKRFGPYIMKLGGETSFRIELSDFFWVGLLVFLLRDVWNGYRPGLRVPRVTFIWISIIILGCGAMSFGQWPLTASHEVVRMLKGMLLFIVVCNELQRPRGFLHCAAGFVWALIVQSVIGLTEHFTHHLLGLSKFGESDPGTINDLMENSVRTEKVYRVGALLSHPNTFGIFLAVVLPVAIGLFLVKTGTIYKLLSCCGVVLGMPALIATFSRSSWASFAASFTVLMLLVFFHRRLRWKALLPATAATIGLVIVLAAYSGQIMVRLFESDAGATLNRARFEDEAKVVIGERPWLGWGLNSYALAVVPFTKYTSWGNQEFFQSWVPVVHNVYYLWLAETGLIGLVLHLSLIGSIIWTSMQNLRVKNELLFIFNAACLSGMVAFLVDGFNDPALRNNLMLRVFWVQAGIVMAVRYWRLQHEATLTHPGQGPAVTSPAPRFPLPAASLGRYATELGGEINPSL